MPWRNICLTGKDYPGLANRKIGSFLNASDYNFFIDEAVKVFDRDGELICMLLRNALDRDLQKQCVQTLSTLKGELSNRSTVVGKGSSLQRIKQDGTLSVRRAVPRRILKELRAQGVKSDYLGWTDASLREPFCRPTAWTSRCPEAYAATNDLASGVRRQALPQISSAPVQHSGRVHVSGAQQVSLLQIGNNLHGDRQPQFENRCPPR